MSEKVGVKETKELLEAVNILVVHLIREFKDGIQLGDFLELYSKLISDDEFKEKMVQAYLGVSAIPAELEDIDVREIIELSSYQLSFLPEIIDVIKK